RLRLQPDARPAAPARHTRARTPVGPGQRRARGPADPCRRSLLRLHRRPGVELRRRLEGSGGVTASRVDRVSGPLRRDGEPSDAAGRLCPADYRYPPAVFDRSPDLGAQVLYVVGGLYGNLPALDCVERLAEQEQATVVLNGDFHWFDAEPAWF